MPSLFSFIDPSKTVYPEQWVLSLVAKPQGKNPEHAMVIVEGLLANGTQFLYRRYDFVAKTQPQNPLQKVPGLVVIKNDTKTLTDFTEAEREEHFWPTIMKDLTQQEGCQGASWVISVDEANALHEAVEQDQKRAEPLDYYLPGKHSLLAPSSSMQAGHNCFTWARAKILALKNPHIQQDERLTLSLADFIGARTTRHINPPTPQPATEPVSAEAPKCRIM